MKNINKIPKLILLGLAGLFGNRAKGGWHQRLSALIWKKVCFKGNNFSTSVSSESCQTILFHSHQINVMSRQMHINSVLKASIQTFITETLVTKCAHFIVIR